MGVEQKVPYDLSDIPLLSEKSAATTAIEAYILVHGLRQGDRLPDHTTFNATRYTFSAAEHVLETKGAINIIPGRYGGVIIENPAVLVPDNEALRYHFGACTQYKLAMVSHAATPGRKFSDIDHLAMAVEALDDIKNRIPNIKSNPRSKQSFEGIMMEFFLRHIEFFGVLRSMHGDDPETQLSDFLSEVKVLPVLRRYSLQERNVHGTHLRLKNILTGIKRSSTEEAVSGMNAHMDEIRRSIPTAPNA